MCGSHVIPIDRAVAERTTNSECSIGLERPDGTAEGVPSPVRVRACPPQRQASPPSGERVLAHPAARPAAAGDPLSPPAALKLCCDGQDATWFS